MESACFRCGKESSEIELVKIKARGEEKWVCVKCLPALIHGGG